MDMQSAFFLHTICYIFKGKNGRVIMSTEFEEGGLLLKSYNSMEGGGESNNISTLPTLIIEAEMDEMTFGDELDAECMYTDMLEDISDGSQYHPTINMIEARYKIRYFIKQRRVECKEGLLSMQNIGKVFHKVLKIVVNEL